MGSMFIARYCNTELTGHSFTEIGDALTAKGFAMTRAHQKSDGILMVPHAKSERVWAKLFMRLPAVEEAVKEPPMSTEVAAAALAGAEVLAGMAKGVGITSRDCGAVHPEGVVCTLPVYAERPCCVDVIYPHDGPHEVTVEGVITHRWISELVITDLPFNSYGEYAEDDGEVA